jgi:hypothetical protein
VVFIIYQYQRDNGNPLYGILIKDIAQDTR